jgi:hypothetical protein
MHNLAHRPAAGAIRRVELVFSQTLHGSAHVCRSRSNRLDEIIALLIRKWTFKMEFADWEPWIAHVARLFPANRNEMIRP